MPTALTHYLIARKTLSALPYAVRAKVSEEYYFLGAQGGDILFFYPAKGHGTLGRYFHGARAVSFLSVLKKSGESSVYSYALGYITHYCADTLYHPAILSRTGAKGGKENLLHVVKHHAVEHAYDGAYSALFLKTNPARFKLFYPKADLSAVKSAFKEYLKGEGLPFKDRAFDFSLRAFYLLNARRTPLHRQRLAENAESYFYAAVAKCVKLILLYERGEISGEFSRHFLTGEGMS